jgi:hypothetical protein
MLDVHWGEASEHAEKEVFGGSAKTRRWVL